MEDLSIKKSKDLARQVNHLINLLSNHEADTRRNSLDNGATCYLCLNPIYENSWRVTEYSIGKCIYDLHDSCYHALLSIAGFSESAVSMPSEKANRYAMLFQENVQTKKAHWNYITSRKRKLDKSVNEPCAISHLP